MSNTATIRRLNDQFRITLKGGQVMLTRGIAARSDLDEILRRIRTFDDFTPDNDPWGEADFGSFKAGQDSVFWKIDYCSPDLSAGSEDSSDHSCARILTIMLASEY